MDANYEGDGTERVSFSDVLLFSDNQTTVYSVCYYFKVLNTTYPTSHTMTVYPKVFPVTLEPTTPVILGDANTTSLHVSLNRYVEVTAGDKIYLGDAECTFESQTLFDVSDEMEFNVYALAGLQSICYAYGGNVDLVAQLATFYVSKYSGLSTKKFAVGVTTLAEIDVVNAAEGDRVAIATSDLSLIHI